MNMSFFAASNSSDGFKNYYPQCFERADRLYIVKGGPGTGKSTLMRRVADIAESLDFDVERYFCSSDHTSLDGVLFRAGREWVGMLDGTHPHPYVERLPAVREEIVNTGLFWNSAELRANGERIRELCAQKSKMYGIAYSYLRACGNLHEVYRSYCSAIADREKIKRWLRRITQSVGKGGGYRELPVLVNSIGMKGMAHLYTLEDLASRIYVLSGDAGQGELMDEVQSLARELETGVRVAVDPIYYNEIQGVYFEDAGIWIVCEGALDGEVCEKYTEKIRRINMRRFCTEEGDDISRTDKRYCLSLTRSCLGGALESLDAAGKYHFELEEIYKGAMDFSGLEGYIEELCRSIFE